MTDAVKLQRPNRDYQSADKPSGVAKTLSLAAIFALLLLLWFVIAEGKYSSAYFSAYQDQELTDIASDYAQALSDDFHISYIEYIPSWIDHTGAITFTHEGKEETLTYTEERLPVLFSAWIDLENPENIRVHFGSKNEPVSLKTEAANSIKRSLDRAHLAVQERIADRKIWKSVFKRTEELSDHE